MIVLRLERRLQHSLFTIFLLFLGNSPSTKSNAFTYQLAYDGFVSSSVVSQFVQGQKMKKTSVNGGHDEYGGGGQYDASLASPAITIGVLGSISMNVLLALQKKIKTDWPLVNEHSPQAGYDHTMEDGCSEELRYEGGVVCGMEYFEEDQKLSFQVHIFPLENDDNIVDKAKFRASSQLHTQQDMIALEGQVLARIDATASVRGAEHRKSADAAAAAREILIQIATMIDSTIGAEESSMMSRWTIQPRTRYGQQSKHFSVTPSSSFSNHPSSVETMVLSSINVEGKKRLAVKYDEVVSVSGRGRNSSPEGTSPFEAVAEVWEYHDAKNNGNVKALFLNNIVRLITEPHDAIHAEAFIHPAITAHPLPQRVAVISEVPIPLIREVLKHTTVRHLEVIGMNHDAMDMIHQYMPEIVEERLCKLDERCNLVREGVDEWLAQMSKMSPSSFSPLFNISNVNMSPDDVQISAEAVAENLIDPCYDENILTLMREKGHSWERDIYCKIHGKTNVNNDKSNTPKANDGYGEEERHDRNMDGKQPYTVHPQFDIIFLDVPLFASSNTCEKWLSVSFHKELSRLMTNDSILVVNAGSPPSINGILSDEGKETEARNDRGGQARDRFLRQISRHRQHGGLDYDFTFVYDELYSAPLASTFIIAFPSENDAYKRFFRRRSGAVDMDLIARTLQDEPGNSRPPIMSSSSSIPAMGAPTIFYDGPTHLRYTEPSRVWETWYCNTHPWKDLPVCTFFLQNLYSPRKHQASTEVKIHPIKGISLYAAEDIPEGNFVSLHDAGTALTFDSMEWRALNDFVNAHPEATMYRQVRDFMVAYGYELYVPGQTGWATSLTSTNTFTNHGCTEDDVTVRPNDDIFLGEDENLLAGFTPVISRRPTLTGVAVVTQRDLKKGDEIITDYHDFRDEMKDHPIFERFLSNMCQQGVGMVKIT